MPSREPRFIVLAFKEPVTAELMDEIDHMLKYRAPVEIQQAQLQTTEAAYRDGFGRLVSTEPKGA